MYILRWSNKTAIFDKCCSAELTEASEKKKSRKSRKTLKSGKNVYAKVAYSKVIIDIFAQNVSESPKRSQKSKKSRKSGKKSLNSGKLRNAKVALDQSIQKLLLTFLPKVSLKAQHGSQKIREKVNFHFHYF